MINPLDALQINTDLARKMIVAFIREEITRVGFTRGILGLSGGIDSALVASLAVEALGADNVIGALMPYRTSNPASRADAELLARQLGIATRVIEITPLVEPYLDQYVSAHPERTLSDSDRSEEESKRKSKERRRGNVMARARMIVLYDQSEAFRALVIGTSNKTEALLGYTTQFGDNAAAIHPLADLYKCQVRQLARALNVPDAIIAKAPSADLWQGQTDEGELGFTYDDADAILYRLVDERRHADDVIALGFDARIVHRIVALVQRNQFKRVLPPVAKISARTVGADFLYNRDWGK
ncbi:MAG: NAD+ synthase [Chloroflexi bacterium]|nr:NAD+ synthase [Chloroflexota bacterium]